MKVGILTDLHGNIDAFNVVYKRFLELGVEKILNLGDMIGLGPYSNEVVEKIISLKDMVISVKGNHEGYFLNGLPQVVHGRQIREDELNHHHWVHSLLSDSSKEFIKSLKSVENFYIEDKKIVLVHYPEDQNGKYKKVIMNPSSLECKELFDNYDGDVFLFGHTHYENVKCINNKYYINPGSTGCHTYHTYVSFGVLEIENGNIKYNQYTENYDYEKVQKEIKNMNYPMNQVVLEVFYGIRKH